MEHGHFTHEKLQVFQVAREVLALEIAERSKLRGLPGDTASQLERALVSVVANTAEGAGRQSPPDRRRHYAIARGSANEAGAMLDIATLFGAFSEATSTAIRSRLIRV